MNNQKYDYLITSFPKKTIQVKESNTAEGGDKYFRLFAVNNLEILIPSNKKARNTFNSSIQPKYEGLKYNLKPNNSACKILNILAPKDRTCYHLTKVRYARSV